MGRTSLNEDIFLALAHPIRRAVLEELADGGEKAATLLAGHHHVSASLLSQHLKVLKDSGLVSERREGRNRIYRLEAQPLEQISRWVGQFGSFWDNRLAALGEHLLTKTTRDKAKEAPHEHDQQKKSQSRSLLCQTQD